MQGLSRSTHVALHYTLVQGEELISLQVVFGQEEDKRVTQQGVARRCRYFARVADERMGPADQAVLVTHQPRWLADWFHGALGSHPYPFFLRMTSSFLGSCAWRPYSSPGPRFHGPILAP